MSEMTMVCDYPDCDCPISVPEGAKPSVATQCPRPRRRVTETLAECDVGGDAYALMEFLREHLNSATKVHVNARRAVIFRSLETNMIVLQLDQE